MKKFLVHLRNKKTMEHISLIVLSENVDEATHSLCGNVIGYDCEYEWLGSEPYRM